MKVIERYQCEKCETVWRSAKKAKECEESCRGKLSKELHVRSIVIECPGCKKCWDVRLDIESATKERNVND